MSRFGTRRASSTQPGIKKVGLAVKTRKQDRPALQDGLAWSVVWKPRRRMALCPFLGSPSVWRRMFPRLARTARRGEAFGLSVRAGRVGIAQPRPTVMAAIVPWLWIRGSPLFRREGWPTLWSVITTKLSSGETHGGHWNPGETSPSAAATGSALPHTSNFEHSVLAAHPLPFFRQSSATHTVSRRPHNVSR